MSGGWWSVGVVGGVEGSGRWCWCCWWWVVLEVLKVVVGGVGGCGGWCLWWWLL